MCVAEEEGMRLLSQQKECAEASAAANDELRAIEAEYETVMSQVSSMTNKDMELSSALEELDSTLRSRQAKVCVQPHYCPHLIRCVIVFASTLFPSRMYWGLLCNVTSLPVSLRMRGLHWPSLPKPNV